MDEEKKLQLWLDMIQDTINIICIVLCWIYINRYLAILIGLYEFIRIGTYFQLGQKAADKVQKMYLDAFR